MITSDFLLLDNQSLLSTSVENSTGGGGDISINSDVLRANNNSDIVANAVFGTGGNINIATQGLFLDVDSQINASSEFGIDGNVNIETTENKNGIVRLPEVIRDRSEQMSCCHRPPTISNSARALRHRPHPIASTPDTTASHDSHHRLALLLRASQCSQRGRKLWSLQDEDHV